MWRKPFCSIWSVCGLKLNNGAALAYPEGPHCDDVNDDGLTDLLGHYRTRETGIAFGDTETCLTGQIDGTLFEACDDIRPVP